MSLQDHLEQYNTLKRLHIFKQHSELLVRQGRGCKGRLEAEVHTIARAVVCESVATSVGLLLEKRYLCAAPEQHAKL